MTIFEVRNNGVYVTDKDLTKFLEFKNVVKFSEGIFNNKFIVRVAHKNGLYMLYTDDHKEQKHFMAILEKGCGRREE